MVTKAVSPIITLGALAEFRPHFPSLSPYILTPRGFWPLSTWTQCMITRRITRKDALFVAICFAGLVLLGRTLLSSHRQSPLQQRAARLAERAEQPDHEHWEALAGESAAIDEQFRQHWLTTGIQPAPPAPLAQRIRRVSLALTGSIPSLEELRVLEEIDEQWRFQWWVDHLLEDRRTADHVAERLTRAYVGTENGPFLLYRRSRFREWLGNEFARNRPYDELVRDLIAGNGLWTSAPEVNFLTVTLEANDDGQPDPIRLAGRTSRAFLGMRIDCLQCHDDKMSQVAFGVNGDIRDGRQDDFHNLAAFFCDAKVSLLGLHNAEGGSHAFERPGTGESEQATPQPPYLPDAAPSEGPLRHRLAQWVTAKENRPFARTAVNRMWALAYGRPLVDPIDDIPYITPLGGYPPGLELLADDFIEHGCDLHRLLRLIVSLEPFHLDSRDTEQTLTDQHHWEWAAFPLTRLRPDQMAASILQACSLETRDSDRHFIVQLQTAAGKNDFVRRYGDTGEDEFTETPGTLPQRLVMMNGRLLKEQTRPDNILGAASRIAQLADDGEHAVNIAYQCVLTRKPTEAERSHFAPRIDQARGFQRRTQLEDLFWVLLNSTEFNWNH